MKAKKSWQEKLGDNKGLPKIGRVMGRMTRRWGTGTMVIPAPREVDDLMRMVPTGRLTTINEIRSALAKKHRVSIACPITTGIFAWIAAHAAEEAAAAGRKNLTPYWRTLKSGGQLNQSHIALRASAARQVEDVRAARCRGLFPLTPALSLGERVNHSLRGEPIQTSRLSTTRCALFPLPEGEGQGEGRLGRTRKMSYIPGTR